MEGIVHMLRAGPHHPSTLRPFHKIDGSLRMTMLGERRRAR